MDGAQVRVANVIALLTRPLIGIPLALIVGVAVGYGWGRIDGRASGKVEQLQATVDAIENRKDIDNEVSDMDRYGICIELGGVPDACAAVRRADEAASAE